jgi:hypothetical protein
MLSRASLLAASAALLAASAAALVACDSVDDRPVKTLSLAELNDSCTERVRATPDAELHALARLSCAQLDNSAEECAPEALAECADGFYATMRERLRCDFAAEVYADAQTCGAANETLLDCIGGYYSMFGAFEAATCENLDVLPQPTLPPACATLAAACPGLEIDILEDQVTVRQESPAP